MYEYILGIASKAIGWGFFILLAVIYALMLIFTVQMSLKMYGLYQKVKNLPTSKARSAAVGLVEMCGKAKAVQPMLSPITRKPCVYYSLQCRGKIFLSKHTSLVYSKEEYSDFYVEDDTGRMLVRAKGCFFDPIKGYSKYKGGREELPEEVKRFLNENEEARKQFDKYPLHTFTIEEKVISEENDVYVLGTVVNSGGKTGSVQEGLEIIKGSEDVLYVSDSDEKRIISSIRDKMFGFMLFALIAIGFFVWYFYGFVIGW